MEASLNGPFGRVALGPTLLTIGRIPDNQLVLADAGVSSYHAEIRPLGQEDYALVDLGSTNGTFLNEQRLFHHVPSPLHAGDIVRVGDTRFTYEVANISETEPTVYGGSRWGSEPSSLPRVAAPPVLAGYGSYQSSPPPAAGLESFVYPADAPYPATGYGSVAQPAAYQPPPPPPAPVYPEPATYPPGAPYSSPTPAKPWKRRGLWIGLGTLGAIGVLVAIGLIIFGAITYANRSTPTRTLNAFCNALKSGDYQTAYNQLSGGLQSQFGSEAQFAASYSSSPDLGKFTNCTVNTVDDAAGMGAISNTFASGHTVIYDYTLVNENGAWEISSRQLRSTPALTLYAYCDAINKGDYPAAYNQLSSTAQSQQSEAQFAARFGPGQLTGCAVDQADDAAGTGTITYTSSSGYKITADYTLVKESATWKLNSQQLHSSPTVTLLTYCSALESRNYSLAYNQLSSSVQSRETEAQFAATFSSGWLADCTVSNINDAAGTGTITYTSNSGYKYTDDYTLVVQNGTWKLNSQQLRSSPTVTLLTYCNALESGNYPLAYNQLSSGLKSQITEAQFAAAFKIRVTHCTVSNVNDSAGTGTISFTYANGSSQVNDFSLIEEYGTWKINNGRARS